MEQVFIAVFGLASIFLISSADPKKMKYGFVCGLLAEPFWFYTAFVNYQYGIMVLVICYAFCHARGFINCLDLDLTEQGDKNANL